MDRGDLNRESSRIVIIGVIALTHTGIYAYICTVNIFTAKGGTSSNGEAETFLQGADDCGRVRLQNVRIY